MKSDNISKKYTISNMLASIMLVLFCLNIICGITSCFLCEKSASVLVRVEIIISIVYIIIEIIDDGFCWYNAELLRAKNSIEDAFNVDLSEYKTVGYYNNSANPSLKRYILNAFESNFFSYNIASSMLPKSLIKSVLALILFMVACLYLTGETVLIVSQTVFSSMIILDSVYLLIYSGRLKKLYECAYTQIVTVGINCREQYVWALSYALEYELIKAYYKVRLSKNTFKRLNDKLSLEWTTIERKAKLY